MHESFEYDTLGNAVTYSKLDRAYLLGDQSHSSGAGSLQRGIDGEQKVVGGEAISNHWEGY